MDRKSKSSFRQPWSYPIALSALISILVNTPLKTQTPPLQVPSPQDVRPFPTTLPSPELPQPLPPPEELLQPNRPTSTPQENLPGVPQTINVERFVVVGSTVFSRKQLAKVLAPFTNRPISFAELFSARLAIAQLYFENGYITSGAYIPPQTLQGKGSDNQRPRRRIRKYSSHGDKISSPQLRASANCHSNKSSSKSRSPFTSLATAATQSFN